MTSTARWSGRPAVAGALGHRAHVELDGAASRWPRPQALRGESLVHPGLLTISATAGPTTAVGIGVTVVLCTGASRPARGPTTGAVRRLEAPARTSDAALPPRP